jgi:Co/Zn/Cd efflux system component
MNRSVFQISKMDCASEEQMVRMKLNGDRSVSHLEFDLFNRKLTVYHRSSPQIIAGKIDELKLGSTLVETSESDTIKSNSASGSESKLLWKVLLINFTCFIVELAAGFIARSMGLLADSLDMLADSLVYGMSLYAVGRTALLKKNIAKISGGLQMILALTGFAEVIRRFLGYDDAPDFWLMIGVSIIALTGNATSLWLLQKSRSNEAHMRASVIFTSNDVIINLGVILAAVLVYLTNSNKPDLVVGTMVFIIVFRGAIRILNLAK